MTRTNRKHSKTRKVSRRRGIEKLESRVLLAGDIEFRSFDGSGNNQDNLSWGAANSQLLRLTDVEYGPGPDPEVVRDVDGNLVDVTFPALAPRLDSDGDTINPRTVSNIVFQQEDVDPERSRLNEFYVPVGPVPRSRSGFNRRLCPSWRFHAIRLWARTSPLRTMSWFPCYVHALKWTNLESLSRSTRSRRTSTRRTFTVPIMRKSEGLRATMADSC